MKTETRIVWALRYRVPKPRGSGSAPPPLRRRHPVGNRRAIVSIAGRAAVNAVRKERGLKPITTKYARVARDPGREEQR